MLITTSTGERILVIERGSEAFESLRDAVTSSDTRKISLELRRDGLAFKRNEYMWSPTLEPERV
jgi:hypothetical protein